MTTKEIAKKIREEIKLKFPKCKFSTTKDTWSITVALMIADRKIIRDVKDISERAFWRYANKGYTKENIIENQKKRYHQLSPYINIYGRMEYFLQKKGITYLGLCWT